MNSDLVRIGEGVLLGLGVLVFAVDEPVLLALAFGFVGAALLAAGVTRRLARRWRVMS